MTKHTLTFEMTLWDKATETDCLTLEVIVPYTYHAGSPETGRFGPPENYDAGSGDEVDWAEDEIIAHVVEGADGERTEKVGELPRWLSIRIDKHIRDVMRDQMIEQAIEDGGEF